MALIGVWLAKLATSPVVANLIVPALSRALIQFFERQAARLELKTAVKVAKVAKTAEELRDASKRLSDSTRR